MHEKTSAKVKTTVHEQAGNEWPNESRTVQFMPLDTAPSWMERITVSSVHKLRKVVPVLFLLLSDITAIFISVALSLWINKSVLSFGSGTIPYVFLGTYWGVLLFGYLFAGLYADIALSSPGELKRLTLTTIVTTIIMALVTIALKNPFDSHVSTFVIALACALLAVPLMRAITRSLFSRRRWWGRKAIIMGKDMTTAKRLVGSLRAQPRLGIKPAGILTTENDKSNRYNLGLPQLNGPGPALKHAREHGIDYAIITLSDLNEPEGLALIRRYETYFKHWLIVPYFSQNYSLWVESKDLNGMLGLEITNRLNRSTDRIAKRTMDLLLTLAGGLVVLPLCLLIALAIKFDSKGPVLYSQERIGKDGKRFRAFKFRSMVQNADVILHDYLEEHPELMEEWRETQKLKNDPRITALGNFLRRSSLDELPQLINVLRGDMSLVGPRPIVEDEIERYDWVWNLYKRARPGITGQWQISGRNDTSYRERTNMDAYYIRNWSIWLDIHILARTISVVLKRDGAY